MLPRLHVVTDDAVLRTNAFVEHAAALLELGPDIALHLRGHGTPGRTLQQLGERLVAIARTHGAALFVNDRVDVACAVQAHGVQLGTRSLPLAAARALLGADAAMGYSAHGASESQHAAAAGADFVVVGSIFASPSHAGGVASGVGLIESIAMAATVPVIGIGGITAGHVADVVAAGAYGVAVLGGIWRAPQPHLAATEYIAALRDAFGTGDLQEKQA